MTWIFGCHQHSSGRKSHASEWQNQARLRADALAFPVNTSKHFSDFSVHIYYLLAYIWPAVYHLTCVSAVWWQCESDSPTDGHVEVTDLDPRRDFPPLLFLPHSFLLPPHKKNISAFSVTQERVRGKLGEEGVNRSRLRVFHDLFLLPKNMISFQLVNVDFFSIWKQSNNAWKRFIKHIPPNFFFVTHL